MNPFDDELKTGVDTIDRVHADLLRLARDLQRAVAEGRSAEEVGSILNEFDTYARQDFLHEESCMREAGFPSYVQHKQEHESLATDIARLKAEVRNVGPTSALAVHLQRRIREWLVSHLNMADRELCDYLNAAE